MLPNLAIKVHRNRINWRDQRSVGKKLDEKQRLPKNYFRACKEPARKIALLNNRSRLKPKGTRLTFDFSPSDRNFLKKIQLLLLPSNPIFCSILSHEISKCLFRRIFLSSYFDVSTSVLQIILYCNIFIQILLKKDLKISIKKLKVYKFSDIFNQYYRSALFLM